MEKKTYKRRTILKALAGIPVLGFFAYETLRKLDFDRDKKSRVIKELGLDDLKAPEITRKRLYIETMETVLSETRTVMIDAKGSNNLLYLPLDKLAGQSSSNQSVEIFESRNVKGQPTRRATQPALRTSSRGRDVRGR